MARRKDPVLREALLDRLPGGVDAKSAFDGGGRIGQLKKALAERALNAKRDHPLLSEGSSGNSRNGYGKKRVLTEDGSLGRYRATGHRALILSFWRKTRGGFQGSTTRSSRWMRAAGARARSLPMFRSDTARMSRRT